MLKAIADFSAGYPTAPHHGHGSDGAPGYSFDYDFNEIIIAIRNQSGINLVVPAKGAVSLVGVPAGVPDAGRGALHHEPDEYTHL